MRLEGLSHRGGRCRWTFRAARPVMEDPRFRDSCWAISIRTLRPSFGCTPAARKFRGEHIGCHFLSQVTMQFSDRLPDPRVQHRLASPAEWSLCSCDEAPGWLSVLARSESAIQNALTPVLRGEVAPPIEDPCRPRGIRAPVRKRLRRVVHRASAPLPLCAALPRGLPARRSCPRHSRH